VGRSTSKQQVCDYCGKVKAGPMKFCIGHSKIDSTVDGEFAWTMHEGTGKMSCDGRDCWEQGVNEGRAAIESHCSMVNMRAKAWKDGVRS
jgi:hypothetical protein